jgi:hypothetical protein
LRQRLFAGDIAADIGLFSGLVIVLGVAAQLLFLRVLGYAPRAWYDLPLLALVAAAIEILAAGLCRASWARLGRIVLALGLALVLLAAARPRLRMRMTNVDLVAARIGAEASRGDLVLLGEWPWGISFRRYYQGAAPWLTLPELADHRIHRYDLLLAKLASPQPIDDVRQAVVQTLSGGHRVWLVGPPRLPPPGHPAPMLPPAPGAPWGWNDLPYVTSWQLQIGAVLRDHAAALRRIPVAASGDPVSPLEDLPLEVAEGWRP